jgi:hypothetical protein
MNIDTASSPTNSVTTNEITRRDDPEYGLNFRRLENLEPIIFPSLPPVCVSLLWFTVRRSPFLDYIASNIRMTIELKTIWKKADVA